MGWIYAASRRSGRLTPVDADDEEYPMNAFACVAEIRAFAIRCPACGAPYEIRARDSRPRIFDRQRQRFRCNRCRFTAPVRVTVDCGLAPDEPERVAGQ
jgi:transposase-like protein